MNYLKELNNFAKYVFYELSTVKIFKYSMILKVFRKSHTFNCTEKRENYLKFPSYEIMSLLLRISKIFEFLKNSDSKQDYSNSLSFKNTTNVLQAFYGTLR